MIRFAFEYLIFPVGNYLFNKDPINLIIWCDPICAPIFLDFSKSDMDCDWCKHGLFRPATWLFVINGPNMRVGFHMENTIEKAI